MATTTNYGWTTPDDTALVKDGASAIRTLGSSVDTTTKALNPSTTLGDIEYRSSTANTNTRLGIGTTGQVLAVSGGVPAWTNLSSGGMTLLSTTTLSGTSTTISSINQTYQDLYIVINNPYRNVLGDSGGMRINPNNTASLFTGLEIQTTTVSARTLSNFGSATLGVASAPTTDNGFFYIRNYTSTTNAKSCYFSISIAGTTYNLFGFIQTASAISSLVFTSSGGGMEYSGGTVQVYGVK
jgi:hypothetical protein